MKPRTIREITGRVSRFTYPIVGGLAVLYIVALAKEGTALEEYPVLALALALGWVVFGGISKVIERKKAPKDAHAETESPDDPSVVFEPRAGVNADDDAGTGPADARSDR